MTNLSKELCKICGFEPNCYFKQLARKTQECDQKDERIIELTKEALSLKQECEELKKKLRELEGGIKFGIKIRKN